MHLNSYTTISNSSSPTKSKQLVLAQMPHPKLTLWRWCRLPLLVTATDMLPYRSKLCVDHEAMKSANYVVSCKESERQRNTYSQPPQAITKKPVKLVSFRIQLFLFLLPHMPQTIFSRIWRRLECFQLPWFSICPPAAGSMIMDDVGRWSSRKANRERKKSRSWLKQ